MPFWTIRRKCSRQRRTWPTACRTRRKAKSCTTWCEGWFCTAMVRVERDGVEAMMSVLGSFCFALGAAGICSVDEDTDKTRHSAGANKGPGPGVSPDHGNGATDDAGNADGKATKNPAPAVSGSRTDDLRLQFLSVSGLVFRHDQDSLRCSRAYLIVASENFGRRKRSFIGLGAYGVSGFCLAKGSGAVRGHALFGIPSRPSGYPGRQPANRQPLPENRRRWECPWC